jgi:nucleotide-binding universal stress UspA family protein
MGELRVVGVDGSPASYTALQWALAYAGRTGATMPAAPLAVTMAAHPLPAAICLVHRAAYAWAAAGAAGSG